MFDPNSNREHRKSVNYLYTQLFAWETWNCARKKKRFSDEEQQILHEMTGFSYENRSLCAKNLVFRIVVT